MALGFIKKIFSFGRDDKAAEPPRPETVPEVIPVAEVVEPAPAADTAALSIDPVTAEHLGDRLIVPDSLHPDDLDQDIVDPAIEAREQAESVAEFNETVEEEPSNLPALDPVTAEHIADRLIIPDDLEHFRNDQAAELSKQAESVAEFNETVEQDPPPAIIPPDEPGIDVVEELPEAVVEPDAEPETVSKRIGDSGLVIEPEVPTDTPAAQPVSEPRDEPVVQAVVPEIASDPEPATQPKSEARTAIEEAVELEPQAELPASELASSTEQPIAKPVLPAGFSSTADRIVPEPVTPERKLSWIERLRQGLSRTSAQLTSQITSLFTKRKLDDDTLQDLEDLLIQADLGLETALRITDTLASERYGKDVTGEDVSKIMASEITKVLGPVARPLELDLAHKPHVILVVGVNGTGKTTTIGKLAAKLTRGGLKVMLAAGDTFRAAAIEQLHIWASRTGADIVSSKLGADAAGLAYEAYEKAKQSGHDVLIIDTAGRLQNKTELMAELEKIVRVLGRLDPDAPHTVLQTLDATTGQNALNQVEIFRNVAGVSGLIMTKLDGTARGGILVAISAKHKLPVCFIGVGEGVEDLEPFNAKDFAEAIAGIQNK
jgi:fused signal recognition particle receptor